ncbi:hypothetical protein APHAL10511_003604 [Amanita phalloides]|nr:hypothetical protein APHAL10511_003604 [Amanita phalloides]
MSSFTRALSPSAAAAYSPYHVYAASNATNLMVARHSAIGLARTIDEVVALVPPGWVEFLGPELRDVARTATALSAKRRSLAGLQAHKAKGTLPAFIPKKPPVIQMSKDVRDTPEGQAAAAKLQSEVDKSRSIVLDEAIAIASLEVSVLERELTDMRVYHRLHDAATKCQAAVKERRKYAVIVGEGEEAQVKFEISPAWASELAQLQADILPLALQARLLAEARSHVIEVKEKKKREVRATADAMDVDKDNGPSGTMGRLVDKAVAKAVKKLKNVHSSKPPTTSGKNAKASSSKGGKPKRKQKKKENAKAAAKAGKKRRAKKQSGDAMQVDGSDRKGKGKERA